MIAPTWLRTSAPRPTPSAANKPPATAPPISSSAASPLLMPVSTSRADSSVSPIAAASPPAARHSTKPAPSAATSLANTSRVRSGTASRLGVIVPCRNSVATTRIPSTSAKIWAMLAMSKKSRPGSEAFSKSPASATATQITATRAMAPSVTPHEVRVVRSLSSSAAMVRLTTGRPRSR